MGATLKPADLRRNAIEATVNPFPIPEITPPETKIYFKLSDLDFRGGMIYLIKKH